MHSSRMRTVRSGSRLPGAGFFLPEGGASFWGVLLSLGGASFLEGGASFQGGCFPGVCVCFPGGASKRGVSQHALRQTTPLPLNRMTDRRKNITPTTSSRTVTIHSYLLVRSFQCKYYLVLLAIGKRRTKLKCVLIAGSLESAYSLIWGSHKIWGKGGGDTLDLL